MEGSFGFLLDSFVGVSLIFLRLLLKLRLLLLLLLLHCLFIFTGSAIIDTSSVTSNPTSVNIVSSSLDLAMMLWLVLCGWSFRLELMSVYYGVKNKHPTCGYFVTTAFEDIRLTLRLHRRNHSWWSADFEAKLLNVLRSVEVTPTTHAYWYCQVRVPGIVRVNVYQISKFRNCERNGSLARLREPAPHTNQFSNVLLPLRRGYFQKTALFLRNATGTPQVHSTCCTFTVHDSDSHKTGRGTENKD